ncbi:MAG: Fe-S cluster assembly protein HesB [Actinomycetota bacterium]|nr:Fe-S cluster assembly protein HesB [Actinomycetota bacterium]
MAFYIALNDEANDLLATSPFALLVGMVLDQQIPMERAFIAPYLLSARLGGELSPKRLLEMDIAEVEKVFGEKPALHRFPASMAKRVVEVARIVEDTYGGDASAIWRDAKDGEDLMKRLMSLPGFGKDKAKIFTALLGKQVGLEVPGWQSACDPFGQEGTFMSVADIVDAESMTQVRNFKQAMKAAKK